MESLPVRERGLKQVTSHDIKSLLGVAPRAGAWIEARQSAAQRAMTPSLPVREHGLKLRESRPKAEGAAVALRTGAWIEAWRTPMLLFGPCDEWWIGAEPLFHPSAANPTRCPLLAPPSITIPNEAGSPTPPAPAPATEAIQRGANMKRPQPHAVAPAPTRQPTRHG